MATQDATKVFGAVDAILRLTKALTAAGHEAEALADPMRLRVNGVEIPVSERRVAYASRGVQLELRVGNFQRLLVVVTRTGRVDIDETLRAAEMRKAWEAAEAKLKAAREEAAALQSSVEDLPGEIHVGQAHLRDSEEGEARASLSLRTPPMSLPALRRVLDAYREAIEKERGRG